MSILTTKYMSNLIAKPVIKNKFWIVEKDGKKVATIQSTPTGVTYVQDNIREQFVSIKLLSAKYKIQVAPRNPDHTVKPMTGYEVHGFSCDTKPYNMLFDVTKKLPVYTKTEESKSFYCAGHYLVNYGSGESDEYVQEYCPKKITLNRYKYEGPFASKTDAKAFLKSLRK